MFVLIDCYHATTPISHLLASGLCMQEFQNITVDLLGQLRCCFTYYSLFQMFILFNVGKTDISVLILGPCAESTTHFQPCCMSNVRNGHVALSILVVQT